MGTMGTWHMVTHLVTHLVTHMVTHMATFGHATTAVGFGPEFVE
jgi:hypothetical protein